MSEKIAIVDENNNVIGENTRREVHQKGELHREVYLFVLNRNKQILLTKASDTNKWDCSSAGHFSASDGYEDGIVREAKEEIGLLLNPSSLKKVTVFRHREENLEKINDRFIAIFEAIVDQEIDAYKQDLEEISEIRYFEKDEIIKLLNTNPKMFEPRFITAFKKWNKTTR